MATPSTAQPVSYKPGDPVLINTRDQTASDIKSNLYFPHYGGLYGKILKLYGEEASILIDRDSLPGEIRTRHEEGEKAMRQKWLDGLSEEAKNRLSTKEKEFGLNYAILISVNDLKPFDPETAPKPAVSQTVSAAVKQEARQAAKSAAAAMDMNTGASGLASATRFDSGDNADADEATTRVSESELAAAETAFLEERSRKNGTSR